MTSPSRPEQPEQPHPLRPSLRRLIRAGDELLAIAEAALLQDAVERIPTNTWIDEWQQSRDFHSAAFDLEAQASQAAAPEQDEAVRLREAVKDFLHRWDNPERYHRLPAVDDLRAALASPPPTSMMTLAEYREAVAADEQDAGEWFFHAHGSECDPICVLERLAKGAWVPAPEQDEAVRLRERLLTEIGPERDDAHMCQYRLDLAGVRALLASPPPVPAASDRLTAIFTEADRLRAYFIERGWSIVMEENAFASLDPFIDLARFATPPPVPAALDVLKGELEQMEAVGWPGTSHEYRRGVRYAIDRLSHQSEDA